MWNIPQVIPSPRLLVLATSEPESTITGCNQWLALAKIALKVPHAGRNRSLVANTNMCGEGISKERLEDCNMGEVVGLGNTGVLSDHIQWGEPTASYG